VAPWNNEEDHPRICPAVPVEEEIALVLSHPSNVVGSNQSVLSEGFMHEGGGDYKEVGGMNGIPEHFAEEDNFGGVDGAVICWGKGNNAGACLLLPEPEGGGVKVGADGLVGLAFDIREASFWPWDKFILSWRVELIDGVQGLKWQGCRDSRGRNRVWASEAGLSDLVVDGAIGVVARAWSGGPGSSSRGFACSDWSGKGCSGGGFRIGSG